VHLQIDEVLSVLELTFTHAPAVAQPLFCRLICPGFGFISCRATSGHRLRRPGFAWPALFYPWNWKFPTAPPNPAAGTES
jgi:hypothetical protein